MLTTMATALADEHLFHGELLRRLEHAVAREIALPAVVAEITQAAGATPPDLMEVVGFTARLLRKAVFTSFINILDYGSEASRQQALMLLQQARECRNDQEATALDPKTDITRFLIEQQEIDYENQYLHDRR